MQQQDSDVCNDKLCQAVFVFPRMLTGTSVLQVDRQLGWSW
jgi:hypothetical protein